MIVGFLAATALASTDLIAPVDLDEGWRYRAGDDPAWAQAGFDDASWATTEIPSKSWSSVDELAEADVVWYRKDLDIELHPGQQLAFAADVLGRWDLYVNGRRYAGPRAPEIAEPWPVLVPVDATSGPLTLALRVTQDRTWWPFGGNVGWAILGDQPVVEALLAREHDARLTGSLPVLATSLAAVALGLVHLGLRVRRPDVRGVEAFAIGAVALALSNVPDLVVSLGVAPVMWYHRAVTFALIALAYSALFRSSAEILDIPRRYVVWLSAWMVGRSAFMLAGAWPWWVLPIHTAVPTLFVLGCVAVYTVRGLRRGDRATQVMAVGFAVFLLGPIAIVLEPFLGMAAAPVTALATTLLLGAMAWALSVERVVAALDDLQSAYAASVRFVPTEFLARVGRRNFREVQRGDAVRERMSILFLDVRGFTTLAETRSPEEVFALVNGLLDELEPLIRAQGGFITSYTGDGFAALFPQPTGAVDAATAIQRALDARLARQPEPAIRAGIGVHTGDVVLGTVGGSTYLTVSMVADAVNVAARIEGTTKPYAARVLVTSETAAGIADPTGLREVDRVVVKGRRDPLGLYQVVAAETDDVRARILASSATFASARELYATGRFAEAAEAFASCGDPTAAVLAARCRRLAEEPPERWDGVWRLDSK